MESSKVKFGIEIECLIPSDLAPSRGGYHNGSQIEGFPQGWNAQSDGSIQNNLPGYSAVEIVSPPLKGERGLVEVVAVCQWLVEVGAKVNKSCGLHVHVDGRLLDSDDVARLVGSFKTMESFFYGLNGSNARERMLSNYCKPSSRWLTDNGMSDRYQSLNLQNWLQFQRTSKRTVEFRCFSSTIDAMQVVAVIHLCVSLVCLAKNGVTPEQSVTGIVKQMVNPDYRIVPDAEIWDVLLHMAHQYKRGAVV